MTSTEPEQLYCNRCHHNRYLHGLLGCRNCPCKDFLLWQPKEEPVTMPDYEANELPEWPRQGHAHHSRLRLREAQRAELRRM